MPNTKNHTDNGSMLVSGSEPTKILELLKRMMASPEVPYRVERQVLDEDDNMPPEEDFGPEFIAKMEKDDEDYKNGNYIAYEGGGYVKYVNGKKDSYIPNVPENLKTILNKVINE